jgi:hypothetical protein
MGKRKKKLDILRIEPMGEYFQLWIVGERLKSYFKENKKLPDVIEMYIDDFVRYPSFVENSGLIMYEPKVYGVPIKPYM